MKNVIVAAIAAVSISAQAADNCSKTVSNTDFRMFEQTLTIAPSDGRTFGFLNTISAISCAAQISEIEVVQKLAQARDSGQAREAVEEARKLVVIEAGSNGIF